MIKLTSFHLDNTNVPIRFVKHQTVKEGVTCDIYSFANDDSRDLAIVTVEVDCKTPLQKVLSGDSTIEGYMSGEATLNITDANGYAKAYAFPNDNRYNEVSVEVGETMQWNAKSELMFYEVCTPPYQDGRYEVL